MSTVRSKLLKLRITPEEEAWLEEQVSEGEKSEFARKRIFAEMDQPSTAAVQEPPAESRTSPPEPSAELQRKIRAKMAQGRTSKLAEIEAREELGL